MNPQSRFPFVCVMWADAHAGPEHWEELEPGEGEYVNLTVGILVDPEHGGKQGHVTVAQSQTPDDLFDHVLYIPVGMVRDIKVLCGNS